MIAAWKVIKAVGRWLWDHWYVPLFAGGLILGWLLSGGRSAPPVQQLSTELKAIKYGAQARKLQDQLGAQQAAEEVRKQHAAALQKLSEDQAAQAEELRNDPVALSKFLVRASGSSDS